jgi:hypothetical protein
LLCATLQTPQYAPIHFERRLHNPKSFVFTQNITLLPHLFVHAIPIAQPPRSGLLQIAVSTMLRAGLDAPRNSLLPEHCRYSPIDFSRSIQLSARIHRGLCDPIDVGRDEIDLLAFSRLTHEAAGKVSGELEVR